MDLNSIFLGIAEGNPWGANTGEVRVTRLSFLEAGAYEVDGVEMGPYGISMATWYKPNMFNNTWLVWNPQTVPVRVMLEGTGWKSYPTNNPSDHTTRALVTDWCYQNGSSLEGWPHGHDGYNAGMMDSSVRWRADSELADLVWGGSMNQLWEDGYFDEN